MKLLQLLGLLMTLGQQSFAIWHNDEAALSMIEVYDNVQGYDIPEQDEEVTLSEYLRLNQMTLYDYYTQQPQRITQSLAGELTYRKVTYTHNYRHNPTFSVQMVLLVEVVSRGRTSYIQSLAAYSDAHTLGTNGTAWNQTNSMVSSGLPSTSATGTVVGYFTASGYAKGFTKNGYAPYQSDIMRVTRTYTLN